MAINTESISEFWNSAKSAAITAGTKLVRVLKYVLRELFFFVPFIVLGIVGMDFTREFVFAPDGDENPDHYRILFVAIGLTATLSGISLRCSTACKNDRKKTQFYGAGERLFHATLLFAVATPCVYVTSSDAVLLLDYRPINLVITIGLSISALLFFYCGVTYVFMSFLVLHKVLFPGFGEDDIAKALLHEFDEENTIHPP